MVRSGCSEPRDHGTGCSTKPSRSICAPPSITRVMTWISKPASRAARAIGNRCEMKYQSSETRYISRGISGPHGRSCRVFIADDRGKLHDHRRRVGNGVECARFAWKKLDDVALAEAPAAHLDATAQHQRDLHGDLVQVPIFAIACLVGLDGNFGRLRAQGGGREISDEPALDHVIQTKDFQPAVLPSGRL